jgi:CheY-like chemotaxis protein
MSHELRTPLNSLLVLARLLAQNPTQNLTPKQVEYANIIHSSGSDLLQLINDILDLSKVEAGKMEVHPERFALASLIEDLEAVFRPLTAEKGLRFSIEPAASAPAEMITDKQRLRQILHNLLSNAVKFTEQGQVELRIAMAEHRLPGSGAVVAFSVNDTGIGISEDNLATIFSAFQQGDGTTSRRYGGAGLGLAICREAAAQLGGQVAVHSDPGSGSTFTLYLPLTLPGGAAEPAPGKTAAPSHNSPDKLGTSANGESPGPTTDASRTSPGGADATGQGRATPATFAAAPVGPTAAAARHDNLQGRKILLVDDDPRNAFALTNVLELYGLTVVHASDGRKAIGQLAAGDIDLVLMDVMMPQLDGHQTTRDAPDAAVREAARDRRNRPCHAKRPGEKPRRRRQRLRHQTRRHRGIAEPHGTMALAGPRKPASRLSPITHGA